MRFYISILLLCCFNISIAQQHDYIKYVNPLTGTAASTTASAKKHGMGTEEVANVIPAVGVPFGMTQWTPQTQLSETKCLPPYYYKSQKINGFRGTHWLSGSCTQDYGSFTIMPISGKLKTRAADYASTYHHEQEFSAPDYYRVVLDDSKITAELTGLARSGMMRFTPDADEDFYLLITPNSDKEKGYIHIDEERGEVSGYNPAYRIYQGLGQPAGFSGYFVIKFEKKLIKSGVYYGNQILGESTIQNKKDLGAYLGFKLKKGESLSIRIGTSFTSLENARENLHAEIKGWNFDVVRKESAAIWNKALGQINVESDIEKNKNIFYTAFYHSMQHPRLFNDVNGSYPKFAHQFENAQLKGANYYDDFSMWDIYRAQLPLFELLQPQKAGEFASSIIRKGDEGGWLPIFPCWNSYTGAMVGDHAMAFLASVYSKKIDGVDYQKAYSLMRQNAFQSPNEQDYKDGKGRRALGDYIKYGYIPLENTVPDAFHKNEQVSRTLEYAYDDYALATMAKGMNKSNDQYLLEKRAKNYVNVYDSTLHFVNGKDKAGSWNKDFNPDKKMTFITEGTPRQYGFYVPHDVPGLAKLMGGEDSLETALDSLFAKGEYWHGNEPGHQIPFMYNYTAAPYKTQIQVNKIRNEEYTDGIGGLSGNDDAGQMSAWYVFAALGFYPLDPVSNQYIITTPLFNKYQIKLTNGKMIKVSVIGNPEKNIYIQSIKLNGTDYSKGYFTYEQLMNGADLEFTLGESPNLNWAVDPENRPTSGLK